MQGGSSSGGGGGMVAPRSARLVIAVSARQRGMTCLGSMVGGVPCLTLVCVPMQSSRKLAQVRGTTSSKSCRVRRMALPTTRG